MRWAVTFDSAGKAIPGGFHIPFNLAGYPYVPHPAMLAGMIPNMNAAIGTVPIAGRGLSVATMQALNARK